MIIEVVGIHASNKGALLMLEAVLSMVRSRFEGAKIAVPVTLPTPLRLSMGLWGTIPHDWGRTDLENFSRLVPARVRRFAAVVRQDETDVLLDASGFGYGDYWGIRKLQRRLVLPLRRWKRGPRKAILLPQAFGPFTTPPLRRAFEEVAGKVDAVYARDQASLKYASELVISPAKLRFAPDFTNLLQSVLPQKLAHLAGSSIVIPNEKVLTGASAPSRGEYLRFLKLSVEELRSRNPRTVLLIHEGKGDRKLAEEVNGALDTPVAVVDEPSALVTKSIIAAADLVVSSRFHGLVSALSSGVTALACGWSHKYLELLGDYDCSDHIVDLADSSSWNRKFRNVMRDADDLLFKRRLADAAARQRDRTTRMWSEVFEIIEPRG